MSYNEPSEYERARLQSEGKQLEADRGYLEASVHALEEEQASLQAEASGIADRIARAAQAPSAPQSSAPLEDRVSAGEGDGDGLEMLTRRLHAVQARLGQIPAEISGKQSELANVAARFQTLITHGRGLLERDSGLKERLTGTRYGIQGETPAISGQNPGAKEALERIVATTSGWQGTVTQQVTQDAQMLAWLENAATGSGPQSTALGHIDVEAIYRPTAYGGAQYSGIDRIERSLLTPPGVDAYAESWSRVPGAEPLRQATAKVYSVLDRGAEKLQDYLAGWLGRSAGPPSYGTPPSSLEGSPGIDLTRYYRPLQKMGEIAYDSTKSVGKSVVHYVTQATSYLSSVIGSLFGRGR